MNPDLAKRIAALSPEQRALFELRLKQKKLNVKNPTSIPKRKATDTLYLSLIQERLWFLHQLQPDLPLYNESSLFRLTGHLNTIVLEKSINEIVRRHDILRTTFQVVDGQPVQIIAPTLTVTLAILDLQEGLDTQNQEKVNEIATKDSGKPFDLTRGPLLRGTLIRLKEQEHIILLTTHHIISDGWSWRVFCRELATLYQAFCNDSPSPLPKLPIQYADFAVWQRQSLDDEVRKRQLVYWQQQLKNAPSILALSTDYPRPAVQSFQGARETLILPQPLTNALKSLSQQQGVTLFMLLLAAFKTLLYRYTGQTDLLVGIPVANRTQIETENLLGCFVNTLVLRTDLANNKAFRELLLRVREVALGAYANQDIPFEQLVKELQPERNLSTTPLFQVMFVLQEAPLQALELPGLKLSPLSVDSGIAKFDLTLFLEETKHGLTGALEYNTDLFNANTITRMLGHYQTLLEGIVANPNECISKFPLLTKVEQNQLLLDWNDTKTDYPLNLCIHQLFEAQVEQTPNAIAVVFEDKQLTYQELNARANMLAHHLQTLNVGPEVLVGICVQRSSCGAAARTLEMVIGLLGILKAGGAYVPLDPAHPQERLAFMLRDSQVSVLLTQKQLAATLPQTTAKVICLDTDWGDIAQNNEENPVTKLTANNLAYVIYTSGSTGQPKGVQISHRAVVNFLNSMRVSPGLTEQDIFLSVTTITFDIAALEVLLPLIVGARTVVVSREVAVDGTQLAHCLARSGATVMQATPATWQLLLAAGWQGGNQLKILCGGEALSQTLAKQLLERGAILWNMYGPTESTIWSTTYQVETEKRISIGRAIANTQVYVLDQHLQLVPVGVPGELYIGGEGLARGYLNRPELTAQRFIPHPFSSKPGTLLYKTGDLARFLADGNLEFLGRIDYQVKIRGYRIELGDIETALTQHPTVRESVVIVREDKPNDKRLVAYVVLNQEGEAIPNLRCFLMKYLPEYMIPSVFSFLDALPLTPNGKVNRRALPAPELVQSELAKTFVAPQTPVEQVLGEIWCQILGIKQVGIYDNFFELGGHSLLVTQVISQLRGAFQVELPMRLLFEAPTVASLAERLETAIAEQKSSGVEAISIEPISRENELPLSFAQQRLWFLDQLEPGSPSYNIPSAVLLKGLLNVAALEQSLNEIVRRHEALRTYFPVVEGQPVQRIASTLTIPLQIIDLQDVSATERDAKVECLATEYTQQPFNLLQRPLLRVKLLRLGIHEHVLLLIMHHIISDAWSFGVFVREVSALYEAFCTGKPSPLPELTIQYADFAVWQQQWLHSQALQTQLAYWKQQLSGAKTVLELPIDGPRSPVSTFKGAKQFFVLSPALTQAVKILSQQQETTLFMTLLAAFATLLYHYTRQEDILIGSPIANRNRLETEGLIGFFVNTLVLRANLSNNPSFHEILARVREVALGAYAHQDVPFETLVGELQPERNRSTMPLFQVWFVLQNAPTSDLELPGLSLKLLDVQSGTARHDLKLDLSETPEGLRGFFEYKTDLFNASTIAQMAELFDILLATVVAQPDIKLSLLQKTLAEVQKQQELAKEKEFKEARHRKLGNMGRRAISEVTNL